MKKNSIMENNPELAKEWHPTLNGDLTPESVKPFSMKKVWWQCKEHQGHVWNASPNARQFGAVCPYCSNRKALQGYNDLSTTHPELAKEWHPTLNDGLSANELTASSSRDAWWLCDKGHEWQGIVSNRKKGIGRCPYCSGLYAIKGETDLATTNPELMLEWHPTKNSDITPLNITSRSYKKVWWQCSQKHEWKAVVNQRSQGSRCPYCSNKKALASYNDLATTHPKLAKEWHPTLNGQLSPVDVTISSSKTVWWQCATKHEWQAMIRNRKHDNICPICCNKKKNARHNALSSHNPELAKEWHPTKNGKLKSSDILPFSNEKVWWRCDMNHEWLAQVSSRSLGAGCPKCKKCKKKKSVKLGRDLATINQTLAKEWHPTLNGDLMPENISFASQEKVWWRCSKNSEHNWVASVNGRNGGTGCPYCSNNRVLAGYNDLATTNPQLANEWHKSKNGDLKPEAVTKSSGKQVWWQCNKHDDHVWKASLLSRTAGSGCPYCCNKIVLKGNNDLATTNPDLAKEWHPTLNGVLTPFNIVAGSNKKVWWYCTQKHEWQARVELRRKGYGRCPECAKLAKQNVKNN